MSKESEAKNREARLVAKKAERAAEMRADARQVWNLFSAGKMQPELRELMIFRTLEPYSNRVQVELLLNALVFASDAYLALVRSMAKEGESK